MRHLALLLPLALVAGCKQQAPQPAPSPSPTVAMPRALVAADFDTLELGPRVTGPQGTEANTILSAGADEIGTMTSYVACPKDVAECHPQALPDGTIYTYVYRIAVGRTPETPEGEVSASPTGTTAGPGVTQFRTALPAPAFNHAIGYSRTEAEAALGAADAIEVSSDAGHLIWRVTKGTGWKPDSAITFWWTSTNRPQFREKAYTLELGGKTATAIAPFPMEDKPVEGDKAR